MCATLEMGLAREVAIPEGCVSGDGREHQATNPRNIREQPETQVRKEAFHDWGVEVPSQVPRRQHLAAQSSGSSNADAGNSPAPFSDSMACAHKPWGSHQLACTSRAFLSLR